MSDFVSMVATTSGEVWHVAIRQLKSVIHFVELEHFPPFLRKSRDIVKTPLPLLIATLVAVFFGVVQVVARAEPTEPVVRVFETSRAAVGKARPKTRLAVTPPAHPAVGPLNYGEIIVRISAPGMRGVRDVKTGAWQLETVRPLIPGTTRVFLVQAELVRVRTVLEARGGRQVARRIETAIEKLGFRTVRLTEGKSHVLQWEPPGSDAPAARSIAPARAPKVEP